MTVKLADRILWTEGQIEPLEDRDDLALDLAVGRQRLLEREGIVGRGREPDAPREPGGQFSPGGGGGNGGADSLLKSQLVTGLTKNEVKAINNIDFTNRALRGISAGARNDAATLDGVMQRAPELKNETVVYRGIASSSLTGKSNADSSYDWKQASGVSFVDKGYPFVGADRTVALEYAGMREGGGDAAAIAEIHVPAGTRMLNAGDASPGSDELILPRGLTYDVTSVAMSGLNFPTLKVTARAS